MFALPSPRLGRSIAAAVVLASAAAPFLPAFTQQAAAQTPAVYDCRIGAGGASALTVHGTAVASPSPADVGAAVTLSDVTVNIDLSPLAGSLGGVPSAAVSASATLASGGSITLPTGSFEAVGFHVALAGGTGSTTAHGTPGGTMDIALAEIKLDVPALETITCTPQGAQTVIHVLPLTSNPPLPTPGGGGTAGAATAVTGRPTHAG